jgi:glutathione S-transferase
MHSSFAALRGELPMDFVNLLGFPQASDKLHADIGRIVEIWKDCRARFGGEGAFLFGDFSAADAMFAPVVSRFVTYEVELARFGDDGTAARYRDTIMAMPELRAWRDAAQREV